MHDRWKLLLAAAQSADYSVKFGKIRGVERNAQFRFGPDRSCGADPRCAARQIYASDVDAAFRDREWAHHTLQAALRGCYAEGLHRRVAF